jgi:hypothetical protein
VCRRTVRHGSMDGPARDGGRSDGWWEGAEVGWIGGPLVRDGKGRLRPRRGPAKTRLSLISGCKPTDPHVSPSHSLRARHCRDGCVRASRGEEGDDTRQIGSGEGGRGAPLQGRTGAPGKPFQDRPPALSHICVWRSRPGCAEDTLPFDEGLIVRCNDAENRAGVSGCFGGRACK